jgi:hypothetical protein
LAGFISSFGSKCKACFCLLVAHSDGKATSAAGATAGLKATISQLPACMGISSVEVQQTGSGIDSIRYFVTYGSQKVLLSASGNLVSAAAATTFNAPAADSLLAGLSGDLRSTSTGNQMVGAPTGSYLMTATTVSVLVHIGLIGATIAICCL